MFFIIIFGGEKIRRGTCLVCLNGSYGPVDKSSEFSDVSRSPIRSSTDEDGDNRQEEMIIEERGRRRPGRGQRVRRGRPTNRARRGGRGRGRGRGRGNAGASNIVDQTSIMDDRDSLLQERISRMNEEGKTDLLKNICQKHPQFVFDILNQDSASTPQDGYHPPPGREPPSWCVCTKCRQMPTEEERLCCGQAPHNCFSSLPDFNLVVLDEVVLLVAQKYRQDILAAGPDNDYNRGKRHAAYRQFILWNHGYLGAGNRRVIPSCCVWRIRDKYPDSFGQYRGFVGGRLG